MTLRCAHRGMTVKSQVPVDSREPLSGVLDAKCHDSAQQRPRLVG
jgi:hypothetical protein